MATALSTFADAMEAVTNVTIAPGVYEALANIATPVIPNHFADAITEVIYCPAAR